MVVARNARAFVLDPDFQLPAGLQPIDFHASFGLQRGIGGVVEQIDQQLFQLVAVGLNQDVGAGEQHDRNARFKTRYPPDERLDFQRLQFWRRQARQARVSLHEAAESVGARGDDSQTSLHVLFPIRWR